ncbi:hypothetical protein KUTeg_008884 [Tegillarca granosa]|uniref:Amino acid transporter n=1 Tax=Tegillarca granosa TaxID=220873 RepID=A0ABQ9FF88_TEGGR|nr:hypothetical protein KUTeg_008884 [Tegillarca granosa]
MATDSSKDNPATELEMPENEDQDATNTEKGNGNFCQKCLQSFKENFKENLLLILLLGSVIMGCVIGFTIRTFGQLSARQIMYVQFPGEMLMRMLKMLVLPLIVSSLISGIAGLDAKTCGKMGLRTVAYFGATTLFSVILGIIMAVSIQPGGGATKESLVRHGKAATVNSADTFLDLIRNLFPDNLIVSCITGYRTNEVNQTEKVIETMTLNSTSFNDTMNDTLSNQITSYNTQTILNISTNATERTIERVLEKVVLVPSAGETGQLNILGLVVFSVLMGITVGRMGHKGKPIYDFCTAMTEATMKLFVVFIWYSPIGITFLIAGKICEMKDFGVLLTQVGLYFLTVLCGLLIHGSLILPGLYFLFTRKNPYKFMYGISQAMATAFGTSSSSATMPITLHCLEVNNHIDPRVSTFVIPVGATINMDGTALYEAVAALFIAQVNNYTMSFGQIVTISITATFASIGAAGVPQAGLVTMVIVLSAVGLPVDDITLIIVVDWFLDRFRTMTNVTGDSLGAGIVYHLSKDELPPLHHDDYELATSNQNPLPEKHDTMTAV